MLAQRLRRWANIKITLGFDWDWLTGSILKPRLVGGGGVLISDCTCKSPHRHTWSDREGGGALVGIHSHTLHSDLHYETYIGIM